MVQDDQGTDQAISNSPISGNALELEKKPYGYSGKDKDGTEIIFYRDPTTDSPSRGNWVTEITFSFPGSRCFFAYVIIPLLDLGLLVGSLFWLQK
jgi:hypothetical protein